MTMPPEPSDEFESEDRELAKQLDVQRPVPAAGFRGALGRYLLARDPGYGPRPARLGLMVAAYAGAGTILVGLGALVATGAL